MSRFNVKSTGIEVVKAFSSFVNGRTFVITGASVNSLGAETAISLASASPDTILLLGRTLDKITPVQDQIKALDPTIRTSFVQIDLSSPTSIKIAASKILATCPIIDVLMNSAAIMALKDYTTYTMPSGLPVEAHLAVNHLGHFLLTSLLLPALHAAPSPRVVNITSTAFEYAPFPFDDCNFSSGTTYNPWAGYGISKTANNLFTVGLAKKRKEIKAFVLHPGMINETNIGANVDEESWKQAWAMAKEMGIPPPTRKTLQEGCATGLVAALDPELDGESLCLLSFLAV